MRLGEALSDGLLDEARKVVIARYLVLTEPRCSANLSSGGTCVDTRLAAFKLVDVNVDNPVFPPLIGFDSGEGLEVLE